MTLKKIYEKQLNYVKAIAEDIKRNGCSEEVIKYASKYAQVENAFGDFWRVNFGEVYAYIELEIKDNPINYNMDEIGCFSTTYNELLKELDAKTEKELADTQYAWCYDDVIAKGEYHLEYKTFEN